MRVYLCDIYVIYLLENKNNVELLWTNTATCFDNKSYVFSFINIY